jgi:hypothetical protein
VRVQCRAVERFYVHQNIIAHLNVGEAAVGVDCVSHGLLQFQHYVVRRKPVAMQSFYECLR